MIFQLSFKCIWIVDDVIFHKILCSDLCWFLKKYADLNVGTMPKILVGLLASVPKVNCSIMI